MRVPTPVVLLALVAAASLAYAVLKSTEAPPVEPEEPAPAVATPPPTRKVPMPTTGTLVIRVMTPDSMPLPPGTRAGYVERDVRRLRPAASDGTFRFSDAPLGRVEVVAQAEGYQDGTAIAQVQPLMATEVLVKLGAKP